MPLSVGDKLGPYEILSSIGEGGMGEVYKARDSRLDRIVAVKVSKNEFSERFALEARAIAQLNHPNICQLYDVGPNYLVMEYVEGMPLKGPLPLERAVEYSGQILDALDAAHKKGITHRDLKPANILITKQGIKLLDFGLAKQAGPVKDSESTVTRGLTGQGQILGTLQYMSPEQLQSKDVDARSDLFSFGCVLYEMLTGKRAFEGASAASVIAAILEREPAPLNLAPPLERVIRTCLAKDPEQRFQTALDLKRALKWAIEPQPDGVVIRRGSRRWLVAVAAALVLGAVAAWAVAHLRQAPADERAFRLQIDPPEGGQFVYGNTSGGIALSPDGRTAAYVAYANGKTALWVRPLDAASARPLAGTEGVYDPFWSPDSESVGFFAAGGKVQRMDLAGGAPLTICDVPGGSGRGAVWTNDGRIVLGSIASGLFQVPASGGTPSLLTKLDASHDEGSHRWPQLLPGGRFLYWARAGKPKDHGLYAASFARPAERVRLMDTDTAAFYAPGGEGKSYLLWMRGGTLVAQELDVASLRLAGEPHPLADPVAKIAIISGANVAVSTGGVLLYGSSNTSSRLSWLDRTGKLVGGVGEPGEFSMFRLSPDGRRAVISRDAPGGADLWLLEVQRGVSSRFTFRPGTNAYPVWSPDGRTILFGGGSGGSNNLFRKESSGAGSEERLTQSVNVQDPSDWSGDGRWLLYYAIAPDTAFDLWVLPMTPDGKPAEQARPYLRTPFNETRGRFSPEPNPRWVAYQSDESGRYEVYIQAFPEPGGKFQISTGGGQYPQWGPGGRELFYVSPDLKLMAVSLKLGADSVEPSTPRALFALPIVDNGWSPYDVAPDGQRFLVRAVPQQQAARPLTVIVNWPALLKKGAAAQ
jgi:eukaryotic-like serine/threonine-protein kinase